MDKQTMLTDSSTSPLLPVAAVILCLAHLKEQASCLSKDYVGFHMP